MLCREYLSSYCYDNIDIIIGNNFDDNNNQIIIIKKLNEIFPFPYLYRKKRRNEQILFASDFCTIIKKNCNNSNNRENDNLILIAQSIAIKTNTLEALHPLQFGAACLFDDGTIEVSSILKGLEYGCTVDPVALLIREMILRRDLTDENFKVTNITNSTNIQFRKSAIPKILVMVDQFGVAHAPFAPSRALLVEHGFEKCKILLHEINGNLITIFADDLVPNRSIEHSKSPESRSLTCSDFLGQKHKN